MKTKYPVKVTHHTRTQTLSPPEPEQLITMLKLRFLILLNQTYRQQL